MERRNKSVKNYIYLSVLVIIGGVLRLKYLFEPLWIDEVLFYNWVTNGTTQAFVPVYLVKLYSLIVDIKDPVLLRLPFLLCGLATIPSSWIMFKDKYVKIFIAATMACFPLFVFWSSIAKIYVFAWLFIILAWKWQRFYIPLILTTPLGLVGVNLFKLKKNWKIYLLCVGLVVVMFTLRTDTQRNFLKWEFLKHAKRIWTLLVVSGLMYFCQFIDNWRMGKRVCKV